MPASLPSGFIEIFSGTIKRGDLVYIDSIGWEAAVGVVGVNVGDDGWRVARRLSVILDDQDQISLSSIQRREPTRKRKLLPFAKFIRKLEGKR